jgi:hypothetical protein
MVAEVRSGSIFERDVAGSISGYASCSPKSESNQDIRIMAD